MILAIIYIFMENQEIIQITWETFDGSYFLRKALQAAAGVGCYFILFGL